MNKDASVFYVRLDGDGIKTMSVDCRDEVFETVKKIFLTKFSVVISRATCNEFRENVFNGVRLTPKRRALQERRSRRRATPGICSFVRASERAGCQCQWVNVCACACSLRVKQTKGVVAVAPTVWLVQHVDLVRSLPIVVGSSQQPSSQETLPSLKKATPFSSHFNVFLTEVPRYDPVFVVCQHWKRHFRVRRYPRQTQTCPRLLSPLRR